MSLHYQLIRTDPSYRNFIMMEEMQAEMQPPLCEPEREEPIEHHIVYHHIHSNLSSKQAHSIENNTNQLLALKKIINTLLVGHRPKGNRYNKYIS